MKRCNCGCPPEAVRLLLVLRLAEASANDVGNPAKGEAQHEDDARFAKERLEGQSNHLMAALLGTWCGLVTVEAALPTRNRFL